jgi:hypothetical protein
LKNSGFRLSLVSAICAGIAANFVACHHNDDALYAKVWPCDSNLAEPQCGTTQAGTPMTCFAASSLGGTDFCTEACDPRIGSRDPEHFACLGSGALLKKCLPGNRGDCPEGLSCYRTSANILESDGLCMVTPVCVGDDDCASESPRLTCGGTILHEKFPSPFVSNTNLQCVQRCGDVNGTLPACPPGEECINKVYPDDVSVPNICVPSGCPARPCPPNFYCLRDTAPYYPDICVPGIPGRRCTNEEDCIIGHCVDIGARAKNCALQCDTNETCAALSGVAGLFFCAPGRDPSGPKYCISKGTFAGAFCSLDADCAGEKCSNLEPYYHRSKRTANNLECHAICDAPGTCAAQGSIPFSCLAVDGTYGECYPADFGIACDPNSEVCMGELRCLAEDPALQAISGLSGSQPGTPGGSETLCTRECNDDAGCKSYSLTMYGYCVNGICRPPQPSGDACQRPEQCSSHACSGSGMCE